MSYTKQDIEQKVNGIIIDTLGVMVEDIRPESKMESDLGADSLDAVEITMAIEREFGIHVSDDRFAAMTNATVADIYTMVEQYLTKEEG